MRFLQLKRRIILGGAVLLALFLVAAMQASIVTAATNGAASAASIQGPRQATNVPFNPEAERLRQMVHKGLLAPTVHVLDSLAPTTIVQFPLVPSGVKAAFPNAKGLVTIVRGNRDNAIADTVTVDVENMPPNISFAMDAPNPATSRDGQEGITSGINLEHMGMWFSSLQDAQKVLNDNTLKGTIFDGGNPPLHAGPQAMTDGQAAPVF